jgi:hypothetical protein
LCASDCYPGKGVHFRHNTFVYGDAAANCLGGYTAHLAGSVPVTGGFWVGFSSAQGRPSRDAAVVRVSDAAAVGNIVWLTEGGAVSSFRIAAYGSGLIAAYTRAGSDWLVSLDANGVPTGDPDVVTGAGLATASDLFTHEGGDVGWAAVQAGNVSVARLGQCN